MYSHGEITFLEIAVVWISTAPQSSSKVVVVVLGGLQWMRPTVTVMVLLPLIHNYNAAGGLENESLDMAVDNEQTFCLGFSSHRAPNQYVVLTAAEQHRHKKRKWVFKWRLMIIMNTPPSPAGVQKTYRETSLKVLLQSHGLPPRLHHGISVINWS